MKDPESDPHGGIQLVYDGGVLSAGERARIVLPPDELDAARFLAVSDALPLLNPRNRRRLMAALSALTSGTVAEIDRLDTDL